MVEARLTTPADGAFALTARRFVASTLRILGAEDAAVEDVKLAVSEVFAAAVASTGPAPIVVRLADRESDATIEFDGVSDLDSGGPTNDEAEAFARSHRRQLLESLFPRMEMDEGSVRISVPIA